MLTELPTPPRTLCHKEVTEVLETVNMGSVTTDFECTPKQLRFAEPANEQSMNESSEAEPSSSTTPRVSFQHAVEHTNAIRYDSVLGGPASVEWFRHIGCHLT